MQTSAEVVSALSLYVLLPHLPHVSLVSHVSHVPHTSLSRASHMCLSHVSQAQESAMLWIAREGMHAPVPEGWREELDDSGAQ